MCAYGCDTAATAALPQQPTGRTRRHLRRQSYATAPAAKWDARARVRCGHAGTTSSGEDTKAEAPAQPRHGTNSRMGGAGAGSLRPRHLDEKRRRHCGNGACKAALRRQQQDGKGGRGVAVATPRRRAAGSTQRQLRLHIGVMVPTAKWGRRAGPTPVHAHRHGTLPFNERGRKPGMSSRAGLGSRSWKRPSAAARSPSASSSLITTHDAYSIA